LENHGPWYYEQQYLGYNYRMTDIQAALGISQLKKSDKFLQLEEIMQSSTLKLLSPLMRWLCRTSLTVQTPHGICIS